jgi:hypothetical protein
MKQHSILSENSEHHWTHLNTDGKILLDLGCGRHDTNDLYQSSAIYLGEKGAIKVVAIDGREGEIGYFNSENPNSKKYTFLHRFINSPEDIRELLKEYKPTAIKCDIEEYETNFYDITKEEMIDVTEFGLEYHSLDILEKMTQKLNEWGFEIHTEAKFGFVDAPQMGVLFCSKKSEI